MKYFVRIEEKIWEIEIPDAGDPRRMVIDGKPVEIQASRLDNSGGIELIVEDRPYAARVSPDGCGYQIRIDGHDFEVEIDDERGAAIRQLAGNNRSRRDAGGEIRAPMPGMIVKVNVAEGDEVGKGQGVIIVEAMKMENEISTPVDGIVRKITIEAGNTVKKGEVMMVVETG